MLSGLVSESDVIIDEMRVQGEVEAIEEGIFRWAYFIESVFFATLILMKYNSFDEGNRKEIILMNMALVFCTVLLVFVRSENGGRVSWMYMIGLIASITHIATSHKYKHDALSSALIIMSGILFIRILFAWNIQISPYKSFFTNGHREGDIIYKIYEYDPQYDVDKFYK